MFLQSLKKYQYMYFETLFSKHNKYILNILQQFTQSQRLKNVFAVLKEVFKNMNEWIGSNIHIDLVKYITYSQMHTTNNARRTTNELMNQGVKIDSIQCYNTHQESIILDLVTESDVYDNYSYASCVDWEIEKTPKAHPKKLKFNIDKPETDLKKIDFSIIINNDEINDRNHQQTITRIHT